MTTLALLPPYPVPGRPCSITFTLTESGTNYIRVWVTDAPLGSDLKKKLDANGEHRVHFFTGDVGQAIEFRPDKGGVYKLLCQEYVKGTGYGGGYEDDPNGAPSETKVGSETTLDLVVGQRVTQTLGYGPDTATLVYWIFGDSTRRTSLATHGEDSPAVIDPTSRIAAIAAVDPLVQVYAFNTGSDTLTNIVGDLPTIVTNIVTKFSSHIIVPGPVHTPTTDTDNTLPTGLASQVTPKSLPEIVNRVLVALRNHMLNVDGNDGGDIGSAVFHQHSGDDVTDRTNLPIVQSVGDLAQAYAALGDITRAYDFHRSSHDVHGVGDGANGLMSMPGLIRLHSAFFQVLATFAPAAPPTVNSGVVTAVSIAGFTES